MRNLLSLTALTLVLILCLASPLAAKGGKGGGKGKGGANAASRGPASHHQKHAQRGERTGKHGDERGKHDHGRHDHEHDARDLSDADAATPGHKKEQQLANFQRQRDQKLAQADHLREIAERNGNENLLANADRMEAQALEEYSRKATRLEKFGVSDPALNPGGVTDPVVPSVDPVLPGTPPAAARPPIGRSSWWPLRW